MRAPLVCWFLTIVHFVSISTALQASAPADPGADAELVADLDSRPASVGSGSRGWVEAGGLLFFRRQQDGESSLWRSDGSSAGTWRIRDLDASFVSASLKGGELPDGRLIFSTFDPALGREPWVSDGTTAGTRLFADLCPGPCDSNPGGSGPFAPGGDAGFVRFGGEILFSATPQEDGPARLFAVDGAGAVRQVSELDVVRWVVSGNRLFLLEKTGGRTLWASDGTPASEREIATLDVDFSWSLVPLSQGVLIVARSAVDGSLELYSGSEGGVERIAVFDGDLEFRAAAGGENLAYVMLLDRVIRTDGTAAGTFELAAATGRGQLRGALGRLEERSFFQLVNPAHAPELWTSDGTLEGTVLLREFPAGSDGLSRLTAFGEELYFFAESEDGPGLWRSDGTPGGTEEIRAFREVDGRSSTATTPLGTFEGRLYFAADALATGLEPWSSDGTPEGTELLANLWPDTASSNPRFLVGRPADLVFVADIGTPGTDFFRVTPDGFVEPSFFSEPDVAAVRGPTGARVIFETREDPLLGPTHVMALTPETGDVEEILVVPRIFNSATVGDRLFLLSGRQISSGALRIMDDLWVTRGTPESTVHLVAVGNDSFGAPLGLVPWRGEIYFAAFTEDAGFELWRTDGTPAGTRLALDLEPGPASSTPSLIAAAGDRLYFRAHLGGQSTLAVTDGTAAGTRPLLAVESGLPGAVAVGTRLIWTPPGTAELWATDGTVAGTGPLASFERVGRLTRSGDLAYLAAATREHGLELWATDGTAGGTRQVLDIEPGPESSDPSELVDAGGILLFTARTAGEGREPWASNGTPEGTRRLADVALGPAGSAPRHLTSAGDRIYFSARRDDVGRELFTLPRSLLTARCEAGVGTLCLNGDRFRVEVEWRDFADRQGSGRVVPHRSDDSGLFYFFDSDNWEMLVKVLDGCGFNGHFWVFSAATTNVEYTLRVTDTARAVTREYKNPLGRAAAATTDVRAFATCP